MSGTFCAPKTPEQKYTEEQFRSLRGLFNGETVRDVDGKKHNIGDSITRHYGDVNAEGKKMFEEIVWRSTYKPANDAFDGFNKGDFRRIKNEILKESKNLANPNIGILTKLFGVKRGVMSKWAITNWMNNQLNLGANYERTKYSHYLSANTAISQILRAEILSRSDTNQSKFFPGIKDAQRLEKLENKIALELQNPKSMTNWNKINDLRDKLMEVFNTGGGAVLQEFRKYMEQTPTEFENGNIRFGKNGSKRGFILNENGERFSKNIEKAGQIARQQLNDLGGVLINGINSHKKVIRHAYLHTSNKNTELFNTAIGKRVKSYEQKLDSEIKAIREGIERGNYFPHYLLSTFASVEAIVNKSQKNNWKDGGASLDKLEKVFSNLRQNIGTPQAGHFRKKVPYDTYMKNPLAVIRKYAMDAIAFNRVNYIKNIYMEGMKQLPVQKDGKVSESLTRYLDDMFTLAERGFQDRPEWVNKTVRLLTGFQFLSKIGFGVGTAVRNTMSGMYYLQAMGKRSFADYLGNWNSEANKSVRKIIREVEQEQGFKFEDMASPLFTEGLLPTKGLNMRDADIRQNENGDFILSYNDGKTWRAIDSVMTSATGYGAVLQKVTENFLRKHMFRHSFMTKYNQMVDGGINKAEAKKISQQYALNIVNKFAFEYAAHQKAPIVGGTSKAGGAAGQILFQFFHYPFSFLQLQSSALKNSRDALIARQWDSPDLYVPLKFASLYAFTSLASGLFNLDLHRLMENDSVERVKDLIKVVEGDEEIMGRGYVGPAAGDLFFAATALEWLDLPDNVITDLTVGYNNAYKLTDEEKYTRAMSMLNVQLSKMVNRDWKALQNGNGWNVLMHELGVYPRAWTREMRQTPFDPMNLQFGIGQLGLSSKKKKGKKSQSGFPDLKMKAPSISKKKSKIIKSINQLSSPKKPSYDKFQRNNIMSAINMIKEQQKEEAKVYDPENNRRMILQ